MIIQTVPVMKTAGSQNVLTFQPRVPSGKKTFKTSSI